MNDQQRAAMQMALEALEKADERDGYWSYDIEITALREALAQPQGEPVFLSYDDPLISETIKNDPLYIRGYEAAIEATKEKAAKVCEELWANDKHNAVSGADVCAAAIRSMK